MNGASYKHWQKTKSLDSCGTLYKTDLKVVEGWFEDVYKSLIEEQAISETE